MPYINLAPSLQAIFADLTARVLKLESARFTVPVVATDPTNARNGDVWVNSTSNQMKIKDATGTTRVITWV